MSDRSTSRRAPVPVLGLLGLAVAGAVLFLLVSLGIGGPGLDSFTDDWLYNGVAAAAAAACLARGVLVRVERAGWLALGAGLMLWAAGDIYWTLELADLKPVPYPSIADLLYLVAYPLMYAGSS